MKKRILMLMILSLVLINLTFISAIKVEFQENISKEGAFTAQISGDFLTPIAKDNVIFFRERVDKTGFLEIPLDFSLFKVGDTSYIYTSLSGKNSGIYQMKIEEVRYRQGGQTLNDDIIINFTIGENISDFSFTPGYIETKGDFSIEVENLQEEDIDLGITITTLSGEEDGIINFNEAKESKITFSPGTHTINFGLEGKAESSIKLITLSTARDTYSLPAVITIEDAIIDYSVYSMSPFPSELDVKMSISSTKVKSIFIYNTGSKPLRDIEIILSEELLPYVTLSEDKFGQIFPDSNANFNISVVSGGERTVEGTIEIIASPGLSKIIPVRIIVEADYDASKDDPEPLLPSEQTCGELGLQICAVEETCTGDPLPAKDGVCCVGRCSAVVVSSSGKIIGWLMLIVLIAVGAWFFFNKYKKVKKKEVNVLKIAQRRLKK